MINYSIESEYIYNSATTTKGTQLKYKKNDYFYKIDKSGREGLVEYLVTVLLECSTLKEEDYVHYEQCYINGKAGCRSHNFLKKNEEFVTIQSLFTKLTGKQNFADYLMTKRNAEERLNCILELVDKYGISVFMFREYLNVLVQIDLLIANTDRHVHNYGVLLTENGGFRKAPIFDNGRALNTEKSDTFVSCTLSGSFEEQVTAFSYPVKPLFQIDYDTVYDKMQAIELEYGEIEEIRVLRNRMKEYEYLFRIEKNQ